MFSLPWRIVRKAKHTDPDDWITVPFRYAEAARVSIYTIGCSPQIPDSVRWWIAQWLASYNGQLVHYMRENYGLDIFDDLDRITRDVMPSEPESDEQPSVNLNEPLDHQAWEAWEKQFKEDQ